MSVPLEILATRNNVKTFRQDFREILEYKQESRLYEMYFSQTNGVA